MLSYEKIKTKKKPSPKTITKKSRGKKTAYLKITTIIQYIIILIFFTENIHIYILGQFFFSSSKELVGKIKVREPGRHEGDGDDDDDNDDKKVITDGCVPGR